MESEEHILVVSPMPSYPPTSGNRRRVNGLYRYLKSKGFVVHFALYNMFNSLDGLCDADSHQRMSDTWDYFDFVQKSSRGRSVISRLRSGMLRSRLYQGLALRGLRLPLTHDIDDLCCDALLNFVRWKLRNYPIRAVFVEYVFLSKLLESVPSGVLKIIDTHDLFADRHQRLIRGGLLPQNLTFSKRMENRAFRRADVLLGIQEHECREIESRVNCQVIEVMHFEEPRFLSRPYDKLKRIGVIGSVNITNVTSIRQFIQELTTAGVLDRVSLDVAGAVCSKLDCDLPNVRLLGTVTNLDDFYSGVDLVVNPSIAGTGLKIKSVEAMSYGVPFMSTANGTEGLPTCAFYHRFPDITAMVAHIQQMLADNESLESYRKASVDCFDSYEKRLQSQLEQLVAMLHHSTAISEGM